MTKKITITTTANVSKVYSPKPAAAVIPDWYRDLESYVGGIKRPTLEGSTTATVKRCMPVFDALTSGYILFTYVDVWITQAYDDDNTRIDPWYSWPSIGPLQWHPVHQAPNHPQRNGTVKSYPKWMNPWAIKTPPGYSCLFISPVHRESVFTILPGVVDTDTYPAPVNFPFVLNDPLFEGVIPAGSPMAQVIPFKRDDFEMELKDTPEDFEQAQTTLTLKSKFFDSYKTHFRAKKSYR